MEKAPGQKNRLLRKLRARKGFSLSELLVTLVLVGLISAAVAGGISMIARSYTKVVDRADAEQLLSTTLSKMQDELCFARVDLEKPESTEPWSFISGITGLRIRFKAGDESTGVVMDYLKSKTGTDNIIETYQFTDDKLISGNRMYVTYESCTPQFEGDKCTGFVIKNLHVESLKTEGQILAQLPVDKQDYYVAAINYQAPKPAADTSGGGTPGGGTG